MVSTPRLGVSLMIIILSFYYVYTFAYNCFVRIEILRFVISFRA